MKTLKKFRVIRNSFVSATVLFLTLLASTNVNAQCIDSSKINPYAVCMLTYDPVCGCNGITYSNSCFAENSGVISWTNGECNYLINSLNVSDTLIYAGQSSQIVSSLNETIDWSKYTFTSTDVNILVISNTGRITTLNSGTATINITDINSGFTRSITITVLSNKPNTLVRILNRVKPYSLGVFYINSFDCCNTYTLNSTISNDTIYIRVSGTEMACSSDSTCRYMLSDSLTNIPAGTYKVINPENEHFTTITIREYDNSIDLLYAIKDTLFISDSTHITWDSFTIIPWENYTLISSDESVLTVDNYGTVTAKNYGNATITIVDSINKISKIIEFWVFGIDSSWSRIQVEQVYNSINPYSIQIQYTTIVDDCNIINFGYHLSNDTIYLGVSSTYMLCNPMNYLKKTFTETINNLSLGTYVITDRITTKYFTITDDSDPIFDFFIEEDTISVNSTTYITWNHTETIPIPWANYTLTSSNTSVASVYNVQNDTLADPLILYAGGIIVGNGLGTATITITNIETGTTRSLPIWVVNNSTNTDTEINVTIIPIDGLYNLKIDYTAMFDCCNTQIMGCRVSNDSIYINFASTLMLCSVPDTCRKSFSDVVNDVTAGTYIVTDGKNSKIVKIGIETPDIIGISIKNGGTIIEITFANTVQLYEGIEDDFIIMLNTELKAENQYLVSKVMAKEGDPNTLVLVMETAVPEGNISVQFKNGSAFNTTTGLNDINKSEIKVYPIPVESNLTIEGADITGIKIISIEGKTIMSESTTGGVQNISLENVTSGMYIVKITTSSKTESILIEKK